MLQTVPVARRTNKGISMRNRIVKLAWVGCVLPLAVILIFAIHVFFHYPLIVFKSDVKASTRIVVMFYEPSDVGPLHKDAFELKDQAGRDFGRILIKATKLDFLRMQATAPPGIIVKLFDAEGTLIGQYSIRQGQGVGDCPTWITLRERATEGRQLSQEEVETELDDSTDSKWPHVLPFDFVLPKVH